MLSKPKKYILYLEYETDAKVFSKIKNALIKYTPATSMICTNKYTKIITEDSTTPVNPIKVIQMFTNINVYPTGIGYSRTIYNYIVVNGNLMGFDKWIERTTSQPNKPPVIVGSLGFTLIKDQILIGDDFTIGYTDICDEWTVGYDCDNELGRKKEIAQTCPIKCLEIYLHRKRAAKKIE